MMGNQSIGVFDWINETLSGAGSIVKIVQFKGRHAVSIVEDYNSDATHTLVASLNLELSNNYEAPWDGDPTKITAAAARASWDPVTDPAILAWLQNDRTATPPGGKPISGAGTGTLQIDPLRCNAFRFTVTYVSGSGLYKAHLAME